MKPWHIALGLSAALLILPALRAETPDVVFADFGAAVMELTGGAARPRPHRREPGASAPGGWATSPPTGG